MSVENLFNLSSLPLPKFEKYLSRKGFAFAGRDVQNDTILKMYTYRTSRNFKIIDSFSRAITRGDISTQSVIIYETTSLPEFTDLKIQLKSAGFYCDPEAARDSTSSLLYQKRDLSVRTFSRIQDTVKRYSLLLYKKVFPRPRDIFYANDLLAFNSHEFLVYYFGEKNVKKDIYFLSGDDIAKCSVLFLNTNRQVVFIWEDEANRCAISRLVFGGQQQLKSVVESGKFVAENNWALKSGVRPGMSLSELRMLNGRDFSFYGGNSVNAGAIIPDKKGKLDFVKEEIILGCLNCRDDKFSTAKVVNADDLIEDGKVLFVLSIILH